MPITFRDKLLPIQPVLREHFVGSDESLLTALYQGTMRFAGLRLPTEDFILEESDRVPMAEMASSPLMLRLLQCLLRAQRARRVLEIGTYIGISAMYMAAALPEGGEVITIEKFDHFAEIARRNFARNGLHGRIRLIQGDAFEQLAKLEPDLLFDLIFLDGNKERYDEYFSLLDSRLATGGLFLVDDAFFHGDALNPTARTEKGAGVRRFLELVKENPNYQKVLLPVANGLMLMWKLGAEGR